MLNKKAFLTFVFIVALGYLASFWIQTAAAIPLSPVYTMILFVGTPAIVYLIFTLITGKSTQSSG